MKKQKHSKLTKNQLRKLIQEEFQNIMSEGEYEDAINALAPRSGGQAEEGESAKFADAIAALEIMHQNLEGIIAQLRELPGAPLGTDIAMAHSSLDEALSHLSRRRRRS